MEILVAVVGLAWAAVLLVGLRRFDDRAHLTLVLGFYLGSLYVADTLVPGVAVDRWLNTDGSSSARPVLILPDLVLVYVLARHVRGVSRTALLLAGSLLGATVLGVVLAPFLNDAPMSAVFFWTTPGLRAAGIVLLVDHGIRTLGWTPAARRVLRIAVFGAAFLALQLWTVWAAKRLGRVVGYDLADFWSGFNWDRPALPGSNNNLSASFIAIGFVLMLLFPALHRLSLRWQVGLGVVSVAGTLASEYRTSILAIVGVASVLVGMAVARWARPRWDRRAAVYAAGWASALLAGFVLLVSVAQVVPRVRGLNPVVYVQSVVNKQAYLDSQALARKRAIEEAQKNGETAEEVEGDGLSDDSSTRSRSALVQTALRLWKGTPVVGNGFGGWEFERPTDPAFLKTAITPHNGYAWVGVNTGILGLLCFYVLPLGLAWWRSRSLRVLLAVGTVAFLELATVGVGHSRYIVLMFLVAALFALRPGRLQARYRPGAGPSGRRASRPDAGSPGRRAARAGSVG